MKLCFLKSVPHLFPSSSGNHPLSFSGLALFSHSGEFGMTLPCLLIKGQPDNRRVIQSGQSKAFFGIIYIDYQNKICLCFLLTIKMVDMSLGGRV